MYQLATQREGRGLYVLSGHEDVPVYALPPASAGELAGFKYWDFQYHDGYSLRVDGGRFHIAGRHCHPHFEIFWIRRGSGSFYRNGELIEVGPRTLLVVGPGEVHYWRRSEHLEGAILSVSELFTSAFNFSLPFSELASFLQPHGTRMVRLNAGEDDHLRSFFRLLEHPGDSPNFDQADVIKALLLLLFGRLKGIYAAPSGRPEEAPGLLTRRFEKALLTEFPRLVTVKEFAQHLEISRSYLHRAVLRDTGRSPSRLIHERIVDEGKRLLLHTTDSPARIAQHLGFTSASYFSRFFRRHTDLNPREFRSRSAAA